MKINVQEISGTVNVSYTPTVMATIKNQSSGKQLSVVSKVKRNIKDLKTSALRVLTYKPYINSFFVLILISIALTVITAPIWKP